MEKHDLRTLLDLSAFIRKAAELGNMSMEDILRHADHDIEGLLKGPQWIAQNHWVPRTCGWDTYVSKGLIE